MALDIIARAAAASAQAAAEAAANPANPVGLFTDLPLVSVDAAVKTIVTGGFASAGAGPGAYVSDGLANASLASAHPLFCKVSANGRHFRLLPDDNGLIPVACGGAIGFDTKPAGTDALADEKAILAAAEDYRHAIGAKGVRLDARHYAIRRTPLPGGTSYYACSQYSPIQVRSSSKWTSTHPEGTTIYRRKANGQQCDAADFELCTDYVANFRGGMFFIHGHGDYLAPDPGPETGSFTLDNIRLDGGLRLSMGTAFEVLDKPIWQANNTHCGHLKLSGKAGVIGFASELIYTSSATDTAGALRYLAIGPEVVLGETSGSCINPNGITLRVERCLCYNAYIGIEGWTGGAGGYLKAHFKDITHDNAIQGGVFSGPPATYFEPNEAVANQLPVGFIDVIVERSPLNVGSWITGRITAIDCTPSIGNAATFTESGAEMVDLEIISIADRVSPVGAVSFLGDTSGSELIRNVSVRIQTKRTAHAVANGLKHGAVVYTYGSIGPNVIVNLLSADTHLRPFEVASAAYDWGITFKGFVYTETVAGIDFDCEANNGGTVPNRPYVGLICSGTASGVKNLNLPTNKINPGTRIYIGNMTRNFVNPALPVKVNGGNFRSGTDENINGDYTVACFEFNGNKWRVVERL